MAHNKPELERSGAKVGLAICTFAYGHLCLEGVHVWLNAVLLPFT